MAHLELIPEMLGLCCDLVPRFGPTECAAAFSSVFSPESGGAEDGEQNDRAAEILQWSE